MASFRRLLHQGSSLIVRHSSLQGTKIFRSWTREGFGGGLRGYAAISSPEQTLLKLEEEIRRAHAGKLPLDDEIGQIRHQFDAAKQSFLTVPEALKGIPKMNPEVKIPETCMKFKYDQSLPIRGLYYNKKNGCLLKLDFFASIEPYGCYFGCCKLSREEIVEIYGTPHVGRDQVTRHIGRHT